MGGYARYMVGDQMETFPRVKKRGTTVRGVIIHQAPWKLRLLALGDRRQLP